MKEISKGKFPFGQPVRVLEQEDRSPKDVFVLGVYASAVHACWKGNNGKTIVKALAVASEPEIFWRGEGAEEIIQQIDIPKEVGQLSPAESRYNGPSGIDLDKLYLDPLKITREDAWLCDLVPHHCLNKKQKKAIDRSYTPIMEKHNLPKPLQPPLPTAFTDAFRRKEILKEIDESKAKVLILLGDEPIKWFLSFFNDNWKKLADFGTSESEYGSIHSIDLNGKHIGILPLTHPRQAGELGPGSKEWCNRHKYWRENKANNLLKNMQLT